MVMSHHMNKGMLQSHDYKRLMMTRDPTTSKFSHTNNPRNTVKVKPTVALQSGVGTGGSLGRSFSKSSGFRHSNQLGGHNGSTMNKNAAQNLTVFTRNKRPVSSHPTLNQRSFQNKVTLGRDFTAKQSQQNPSEIYGN